MSSGLSILTIVSIIKIDETSHLQPSGRGRLRTTHTHRSRVPAPGERDGNFFCEIDGGENVLILVDTSIVTRHYYSYRLHAIFSWVHFSIRSFSSSPSLRTNDKLLTVEWGKRWRNNNENKIPNTKTFDWRFSIIAACNAIRSIACASPLATPFTCIC